MNLVSVLKHFLECHEIEYKLVKCPSCDNSVAATVKAGIAPDTIAKCIMLEDEGGCVMALCPSTSRIRLSALCRDINRRLEFASEQEISDLMHGVLPTVVSSHGGQTEIDVVVDEELLTGADIYLESAEDEELVHIPVDGISHLMKNSERASFSQPA